MLADPWKMDRRNILLEYLYIFPVISKKYPRTQRFLLINFDETNFALQNREMDCWQQTAVYVRRGQHTAFFCPEFPKGVPSVHSFTCIFSRSFPENGQQKSAGYKRILRSCAYLYRIIIFLRAQPAPAAPDQLSTLPGYSRNSDAQTDP